MAILEILTYPDPRLREKCEPVTEVDEKTLKLLDDLSQTMYDAPGVGLAAPQVGVNQRITVIDISSQVEEGTHGLIELINPEIIEAHGEQRGEEGCLSIPGFVSKVTRSKRVLVRALNRDEEPFEIEGEGLLARVLQHEIDHLDGILFIDRLGRLKRELLLKKIEKSLEEEAMQPSRLSRI